MEGAIALAQSLGEENSVDRAISAYESKRQMESHDCKRSALVSLQWYEHARRFNAMEPAQYAFNFLTRSKGVTYENLTLRDPDYGTGVNQWFADLVNKEQGFNLSTNPSPAPMFTPFRIGPMVVPNRVMVSPMCQYSADDGTPNDWHMVHLGGMAVGGAGLVYTEMTNVSERPDHAGLRRNVSGRPCSSLETYCRVCPRQQPSEVLHAIGPRG